MQQFKKINSHFDDFEQVKKLVVIFADFEQVKWSFQEKLCYLRDAMPCQWSLYFLVPSYYLQDTMKSIKEVWW